MPLRHEPVALILSRQSLPTLDRSRYAPAAGLAALLAATGATLADEEHTGPRLNPTQMVLH